MPRYTIAFMSLLTACTAFADVAANKRHEIEHLVRFIRDSGCVIDVEGKKLTGLYASAHIQQQYARYRDRILTAEDFIAWTAAQSSVAGKYSLVACKGRETVRAMDWLQRELAVYRIKRRY